MRRNHRVAVGIQDSVGRGVGLLFVTAGTWRGEVNEL
jgi:hypothetical protein